MTSTRRVVAYAHFHRPDDETYREVFSTLADLTPVVQAVPTDAALLDLTGATRYFHRDPADLAVLLQVKVLARFGLLTTVGIAGNPMLATLAAQTAIPGGIHLLPADPQQVTAFLDALPVQALPDIGPKTASALARYGLTTVADLRAVPTTTLQRITTATTGRLLAERAAGTDPRRVQPQDPPASLTARRDFPRDTLDPALTRQALVSITAELGARLRRTGQVTGRVELEVRLADRSTTTRSRTLREATDHDAALQHGIDQLFTSLALQRARLRSVTVRGQRLSPIETASVQLTFDRRTELQRRIDPVVDRATERFGPRALHRATLMSCQQPRRRHAA
jgi:DNA polymerase-4